MITTRKKQVRLRAILSTMGIVFDGQTIDMFGSVRTEDGFIAFP